MCIERLLPIAVLAAAATVLGAVEPADVLSVMSGEQVSFPRIAVIREGEEHLPLWDADRFSSGWMIRIDEELISPAESGWIRQERESGGRYELEYSNREFSLVMRVDLSADRLYARIETEFRNVTKEPVTIVPGLILDTSLGEPTGLPFHLPDNIFINAEYSMDGDDIPIWIRSERSASEPSLVIFPDRSGNERIQSVHLANWLRLKQGGVGFKPQIGRSFDNPPFSPEDSAILLVWRERKINPGESGFNELIIGLDTNLPDEGLFEDTVVRDVGTAEEYRRLRIYTIRRRLSEIDRILDETNGFLDNDEGVRDEDLSGLDVRIGEQERLRSEYENL